MDYEGQKLFEHLSILLFLVEGLVCWGIGFYLKDVDLMAKIYGAGTFLFSCYGFCRSVNDSS